jgi:hypothetical protein
MNTIVVEQVGIRPPWPGAELVVNVILMPWLVPRS